MPDNSKEQPNTQSPQQDATAENSVALSNEKEKLRAAVLAAIEKSSKNKDKPPTEEEVVDAYMKDLDEEDTGAVGVKNSATLMDTVRQMVDDLQHTTGNDKEQSSQESETKDKTKKESEEITEQKTDAKKKQKEQTDSDDTEIKKETTSTISFFDKKFSWLQNVTKFFTAKKEKKGTAQKEKKESHAHKKKNQASGPRFRLNKSGLLLFGLNLLITLVLLSGLSLLALGLGIYKSDVLSTDTKQSLTTLIPYPAGIVNGKVLTIAKMRETVGALNRYYAVQEEENAYFGEQPADGDLQTMVWERFVYHTLLTELADDLNLQVSDDLLNQQLEAIIAETGSYENFEARIAYLYGWDVDTFVTNVIEPFVLQEVVAARVFKDEKLRQERRQFAEELVNALQQNPELFAEYAREYSEDVLTARQGGDMGIFAAGRLTPALNQALADLENGEVSSVIETNEGYEIVKLQQRIPNPDGFDQLEVKRILIRYPTFEFLLQQKQEQATIYRFVR